MERDGIDEEAAYRILRVHSQRTGLSLRMRAEDVVISTRPGRPELGPRREGPRRDNGHRG